jgi:very-short-patch-repair endonuclease
MSETDKAFAAQLGVAHVGQMTESPRTRGRRVDAGLWEQLYRDVFRSTAFPITYHQRLLAAVLAARPDGAISHRAATALFGVDRFESRLVELAVPSYRHPRVPDAVVHRIDDLTPADITMVGPIPVTTRARTLIDLGAVSRPWLVSRALEQWLREGHITIAEVRTQLDRIARPGRSGVGVLRAIPDRRALGTDASDSQAEVVLAEALVAHGAPRPVYHHEIRVGHDLFEVDFAYPDAMLAIEVEGYGPHVLDPRQHDEDCRRQNLITGVGYLLSRFSARRVFSRPHHVAAEIDEMRRSRLAA